MSCVNCVFRPSTPGSGKSAIIDAGGGGAGIDLIGISSRMVIASESLTFVFSFLTYALLPDMVFEFIRE